MPYTSVADFADYAGEVYDAAQQLRVKRMLPLAERKLERRVGTVFFTAGDELIDPDMRTAASQDWVFATCVIADWFLTYDDPDIRADLTGPYQSERLGDWAFTLRKDMWTPYRDARIRDIIQTYTTTRIADSALFITTVGPASYSGETSER